MRDAIRVGDAYPSGRPVAAGWKLAGTADFNADALADIVFRHRTWGIVSIWMMFGEWYMRESPWLPMDTTWKIGALLPAGQPARDTSPVPFSVRYQ